jgi:hypothetical protein
VAMIRRRPVFDAADYARTRAAEFAFATQAVRADPRRPRGGIVDDCARNDDVGTSVITADLPVRSRVQPTSASSKGRLSETGHLNCLRMSTV